MSQESHPIPRVVVGVDGSDESKRALRWAATVATSIGARIEAIAAWQVPTAASWGPAPVEWNPKADMEAALTGAVDDVFGTDRPEHISLTVHEGHAAQVLIRESAGAAMLVVGSRGLGGFTGLLLGSVSANVAEHAHCPVLVIHGGEQHPAVTADREDLQLRSRWAAASEGGTAPGAHGGALGESDDQDRLFSSREVQRLRRAGVL